MFEEAVRLFANVTRLTWAGSCTEARKVAQVCRMQAGKSRRPASCHCCEISRGRQREYRSMNNIFAQYRLTECDCGQSIAPSLATFSKTCWIRIASGFSRSGLIGPVAYADDVVGRVSGLAHSFEMTSSLSEKRRTSNSRRGKPLASGPQTAQSIRSVRQPTAFVH